MQANKETQAMDSVSFCGQVFVFSAHAGTPFCWGSDLVALKMVKEDVSMARIIREQLKLTPRRANFAIRTRVLIF